MQLTSPAFANGTTIPQKYGMDFENMNPPLMLEDVPSGTISSALTVDDPDIPPAVGVSVWDHWVVFNIPRDVREIPEAWVPLAADGGMVPKGICGRGTRGELKYMGPRPPDKEHRYFFRAYALDTTLDLPEGAIKRDIFAAMKSHILAEAELMGRFAPPSK